MIELRLPVTNNDRNILSHCFRLSLFLLVAFLHRERLNGQVDILLKQFNKSFLENYSDPRLKLAGNIYNPTALKTDLTIESAKKTIYTELDKWIYPVGHEPSYYDDSTKNEGYKIKSPILITDEFIQFNTTTAGTIRIAFADILFDNIVLSTPFKDDVTCRLKVGRHNFRSCHNEFADALFFMQYQFSKNYYEDQTEIFVPVAQQYQQLKEKLGISEEQRKYFVQGNAMAEAMNVREAIELYNKALSINPIAYPAGYYNLSCLASLIYNYPLAVCSMKKYLMLVPDVKDAREAQDKIYEWEAFIK